MIPILTVEEIEIAVPLARALAAGGLNVIEITLRTAASFEAIRRIAGEVEGIVTGAGTIRTAKQMDGAVAASAQFLVSPGCTRPARVMYSGAVTTRVIRSCAGAQGASRPAATVR
ncbi:hypothetical protein [Virgifigura deserti]|uniref:hypothetical protein n=1 Tax=Virgifigura deserti TaxID=2268457 RepID=UPI003CCBE7DD